MIRIVDKKDCCGCGACVQRCPKQCIRLCADSEGFLYPQVDESLCIDCGLCEKVCPVLNQVSPKRPDEVYAAMNVDNKIRRESSSGGIFTLLSEKVITDGGVVFGARFDECWQVVHSYVETLDELALFRGSKYVQSNIGDCYKQAELFLKAGREVLFSGTSCQIAGLHRFLQREYENLKTVDVVCHGVPSPLVWKKYIEAVRINLPSVVGKKSICSAAVKTVPIITGISFRNKLDGWKKFAFVVKGYTDIREDEGKSICLPGTESPMVFHESFHENLFMRGFLGNIYLRPSCYACPAKSGKSGSDITLADYWGIERHHPEMDDDGGTSLVLLNTDKGVRMFRQLDCKKLKSTYEQGLMGNSSMECSVSQPFIRKYFFKKFKRKQNIEVLKHTLEKLKPSFYVRLIFKIRQVLTKLKWISES